MDQLVFFWSLLSLLGSAVVAGIFYAFSTFIMKALARLPPSAGTSAMQSINATVYTPWFMAVFMGTTVLAIGTMVWSVVEWGHPAASLQLTGGICYVGGTFLVTGLGNVPLNTALAGVSSEDPASEKVWRHYRRRWTVFNHVRTAAAGAAALAYALGLVRLAPL